MVNSNDLAKVKALLKENPDLVFSQNEVGWTPLHVAAALGHKDVAELLLGNGADVNAQDKKGRTPLDGAAKNGHKAVAELLMGHGAVVSIHDASAVGDLGRIKMLFRDDPNLVFSKDNDGRWVFI